MNVRILSVAEVEATEAALHYQNGQSVILFSAFSACGKHASSLRSACVKARTDCETRVSCPKGQLLAGPAVPDPDVSFVHWPFNVGRQLGKGQFKTRLYFATEE
ncbi:MAG: hypothetical protein ACLP9L_30220 [Thermoguttaceae bacterium]